MPAFFRALYQIQCKEIYSLQQYRNKQTLMENHTKRVFLDIHHSLGNNFSQNGNKALSIVIQSSIPKLICTVGKTILKKNLITNYNQYIPLSDAIEYIVYSTMTPSQDYIAICQKLYSQPNFVLNLYHLHSNDIKHFKFKLDKNTQLKIMSISFNNKYACCLMTSGELMLIDLTRSRSVATSAFRLQEIDTLSFCPSDHHLVSCSGSQGFRLCKFEDYTSKSLQDVKKLPKNRHCTTHSWIDKTKILLCTTKAELFIIMQTGAGFEVKKELNLLTLENIAADVEFTILSICVFSKGFLLGSNQGTFSLWMKDEKSIQNFEDEYKVDLMKQFSLEDAKISDLAQMNMSSNEQYIVMSYKNNGVSYCRMDAITSHAQIKIKEDILNYVENGYHSSAISAIDICLHRPIIATLSKKDSTIRLWNYKQPFCCLIKAFDSKIDEIEPQNQLINCMALHPLGYYISVGCCDKLRIYHILYKQFRHYRDILIKGACKMKFTHGGHMLAIAYPKYKYNNHGISIYNSYSLQQIATINDHSNVIFDLYWTYDDQFLYSISVDGVVCQWNHHTIRKWNHNCKYNGLGFDQHHHQLLCSGHQGSKNWIRGFKTNKESQKLYSLVFKPTCIKWITSQWVVPAILVGCQDGSLKVFNSPFNNLMEQSINSHINQITCIQVSPCGRYVMTGGVDGSIFIYQVMVTDRQGYVNTRLNDQTNQFQLNPLINVVDDELGDIVLTQKDQIVQMQKKIALLEHTAKKLEHKLNTEDRDSALKRQIEIDRANRERQKQLKQMNRQLEQVKSEKKYEEQYSETNFVDTQHKYQAMKESIESLFEKKLAIQNKKYNRLQQKYKQLQLKYAKQIQELQLKSKNTIKILSDEFRQCFKTASSIHQEQQSNIIMNEQVFKEKVSQIEEQHQSELKKISEGIIELSKDKMMREKEYQGSLQNMKRGCKQLKSEINALNADYEQDELTVSNLRAQISQIKTNVNLKDQKLHEQLNTLKNRQEQLAICQDRISDLQKKKEVLSYRTWEIKQEIEPKQDEIQFLKEEIFCLQKEFQTLLQEDKIMKETESKLQRQKVYLTQALHKQLALSKDKLSKIKAIKHDIYLLVQNKNIDKKNMKLEVEQLYNKYAGLMTDNRKITQVPSGMDQMGRHMEYLDKQINQTHKSTGEEMLTRETTMQKITLENTQLINEVVKSREKKTQLENQLRGTDKIIESLKIQINQLRNMSNKQMPIKPAQSKEAGLSLQKPLIRSNSQPLKGKLSKGTNYEPSKLSIFSQAKIRGLERKRDQLRNELVQKQMSVRLMKQSFNQHLQIQKCNDPALNTYDL